MKKIIITISALFPCLCFAGLISLEDSELQKINGQAGVTLETDGHFTIAELAYTDDGNTLQLENIEQGSQADISQNSLHTQVVDIAADGRLQIRSLWRLRRYRLELSVLIILPRASASSGLITVPKVI